MLSHFPSPHLPYAALLPPHSHPGIVPPSCSLLSSVLFPDQALGPSLEHHVSSPPLLHTDLPSTTPLSSSSSHLSCPTAMAAHPHSCSCNVSRLSLAISVVWQARYQICLSQSFSIPQGKKMEAVAILQLWLAPVASVKVGRRTTASNLCPAFYEIS